ncbi:RNA degradosome polyphosphate kinase [Vaginisenegalia massiliensis]|uniref:RNA degradosome polyphosphate kinase n=1 Tax=Vaginisenegalia massiliensis TaxID=2058294 RepID=UPI000F527F1B|nr:RNA degradosome polyphosphate kinase [Vaginisenegalia massiliensis]
MPNTSSFDPLFPQNPPVQNDTDLETLGELDRPEFFFNRELSWLDFNKRVIEEAYDAENPLLEQLKFLAIASSNLDEFYMVRVAGITDQALANIEISENKTRLTPSELLDQISQKNHENIRLQYDRFTELKDALPNLDYTIKKVSELSADELLFAEDYFSQLIAPTLSPIGVDAYRPFPHLNNKVINIFVQLSAIVDESSEESGKKKKKQKNIDPHPISIVPIPALVDRFFIISLGSKNTVVLTEDLITHFIGRLYSGYQVDYAYPFRITRSADFDVTEEGASDLLELIEDYIKKRKNGMAIRLEIDSSMLPDFSSEHCEFLTKALELEVQDVYTFNGPLDLTFLFGLCEQIAQFHPKELFKPFTPALNQEHLGEKLFTAMKEKDIFLNHPYDSFQPVVSLIETAADDEQTIAIKQTLYRVSKHSPIVAALKRAAEKGKEVTVLVELKARFDEENNVYWARELEEAGCHVLYGVRELKTHSKITLIVRKEGNKIQRYLHLGTGNYNDKTAKIYTDMGILTVHPGLTEDASKFFNHLSGYTERPHYVYLHVSPFDIRDSLLDYIDEEIRLHKENGNGQIIAKMNSLTDKPLILKLYEASQAGVKIDLIVRGICCLKPGIPGVSENIHVRSIVGRYLEHSRIYYFKRNGNSHLFLSSADMMTRNMIRRVEIEFPILDADIKQEIYQVLELQLRDTLKARILQADGQYTRPDRSNEKVNSQAKLMQQATETIIKEQTAIIERKARRPWFERILRRFNK